MSRLLKQPGTYLAIVFLIAQIVTKDALYGTLAIINLQFAIYYGTE